MTAFEQLEQYATAYKLKTFGRTDVDAFGRPFLTADQVKSISGLHHKPHYSLQTILRKGGFE